LVEVWGCYHGVAHAAEAVSTPLVGGDEK